MQFFSRPSVNQPAKKSRRRSQPSANGVWKNRRPPCLEVLEDRSLPSGYVVTTTADSGPGSLRDAITQINADTVHTLYPSPSNPSVDEIDFAITAASDTGGGYNGTTGVATITPQSHFPFVTNSVLINGYTQLGASPNTLSQGDNAVLKIQLNLSAMPAGDSGLNVAADNITVQGLVINGLTVAIPAIGVSGNGDVIAGNFLGTDTSGTTIVGDGPGTGGVAFVTGGDDTVGGTTLAARNIVAGFSLGVGDYFLGVGPAPSVVEGNYIGTDATGTKALGNGAGVVLNSYGGTIGGTAPGAGNLISGNQIGIDGGLSSGADETIQGNLIGTDATGATALANGDGIVCYDDDGVNTSLLIGGTSAAARNIISGNFHGIEETGGSGAGVVIEGNYIGTDITGTQAVNSAGYSWLQGNHDGIWVQSGTTVGGTTPGTGNVISGNAIEGIRIFGGNSHIEGNLIGTDYTGTKPIGNGYYGILSQDQSSNNVIGGTQPGAGNTIVYNSSGVTFTVGGTGNTVLGNSIYANGNGGFNAEGIQASPVLFTATTQGGSTSIGGALASLPNTSFRVEFFANASPDPSGYGQGQTYLGFVNVTTDATGTADFIATFAGVGASVPYISTTATRLNGGTPVETSGFSNDVNALATPHAYIVTTTADSGPGSLRDAINQIDLDTGRVLYASPSNPSVDEIDFNITAASDTGGGFNAATGVATITPNTSLPSITNSAIINGYTEPGASVNTLALADNAVLKIVLNSSNVRYPASTGIVINADNSTVSGLVVNGFSYIVVNGTGDVVWGNFVGTDVTGSQAAQGAGIGIGGANDVIGGTAPSARNVISGNVGDGINVSGSSAVIRPVIEGNLIGTTASGTSALGNAHDGINNVFGTGGLVIGGTTAGARNVISGNSYGIEGGYHGFVLIEGNYIGTDVSGTQALGNTTAGISGSGMTIGGTAAGAGNVISGNSSGMFASSDVIEGNLIGTDYSGTKPIANGTGILAYGSNVIGGTAPGAGNVVSGNATGIQLNGTGDVIQGNYIGTDVTGTLAVGNSDGVVVQYGASNNTIGGTTAAARNVISGNIHGDAFGVLIRYAPNNLVEGNYIGTDATGAYALGNGSGVWLDADSVNNTISGNVIAANSGRVGVGLEDFNSPSVPLTGNVVQGNLIGTDATGVHTIDPNGQSLGNAMGLEITYANGNDIESNVITGNNGSSADIGAGITLYASSNNLIHGNAIYKNNGDGVALAVGSSPSSGNVIQSNVITQNSGNGVLAYASNNTVGGTASGAGNTISGNSGDGVLVRYGNGVSILGNSISASGGLGIFLDSSTNANANQAAPVLTSAITSGTGTAISGTLASYPSTAFRIEFFTNPSAAPGQGQTFVGFAQVTSDNQGNFTANLPALLLGTFLSATATDGAGDTSEFSADVTVKGLLVITTNNNLMLVGNNPPPLTGEVNGTPFTSPFNYQTPFGDTITITLGTTATAANPVGQYTITAALSGTNLGNYLTTLSLGTMYVVSVGADPSSPGAQAVTFWDNKGDAKLITAADLSSLVALNLVNQGGAAFDPKAVGQLQAWLSTSPNATASYQLAVQLAVMDLNVLSGYVKSTDLVYAGGLLPYVAADNIAGLTSGGFIDVQDLMQAANTLLGQVSPGSPFSSPGQAYASALTQVFQAANANGDFVKQELIWNLLAL
jgi:hypothetical protein